MRSRFAHDADGHRRLPDGVFRDVERPVYDELMAEQISVAKGKAKASSRRYSAAATSGQF